MKIATRRAIRFLACAELLCLSAALGAQAPPAQAPEWKTYSYSADGFSALFPSAPTMTRQNVDTRNGTFEQHNYILETDKFALFVSVCDYGSKGEGGDPAAVLHAAENGALENSKSHLTRETAITLGIYKGIELESENDSAHFYARLYFIGTTLYQVLTVTKPNQPYSDTLRFLDSFQLIPRTVP